MKDMFALKRAGHFAGCPHDYADTDTNRVVERAKVRMCT